MMHFRQVYLSMDFLCNHKEDVDCRIEVSDCADGQARSVVDAPR